MPFSLKITMRSSYWKEAAPSSCTMFSLGRQISSPPSLMNFSSLVKIKIADPQSSMTSRTFAGIGASAASSSNSAGLTAQRIQYSRHCIRRSDQGCLAGESSSDDLRGNEQWQRPDAAARREEGNDHGNDKCTNDKPASDDVLAAFKSGLTID